MFSHSGLTDLASERKIIGLHLDGNSIKWILYRGEM
jgi:hypothetical protein